MCSTPTTVVPGVSFGVASSCNTCKERARLASGNALLTTVMTSTRPYPLEGSGLNAIINPVSIDGHRGWCDFAAGGYAVFEELLRSSDYFDFVVQHVEPWAGMMRTVRAAAPADRVPERIVELLRRSPARIPGTDNLSLLQQHSYYGRLTAAVLGANPLILTNEDAWRLIDLVRREEAAAASPALSGMIDRLIALARDVAPPASAQSAG